MKRLNGWNKSVSVLLISMMLNACASQPEVRTTEAACKILKPIDFYLCTDGLPETQYNECDTEPTALAIDAYNRDLAALCPSK